jgi:hypothetical protein
VYRRRFLGDGANLETIDADGTSPLQRAKRHWICSLEACPRERLWSRQDGCTEGVEIGLGFLGLSSPHPTGGPSRKMRRDPPLPAEPDCR